MVKPASVDKNGFRRGAWSQEEDDKLRAYIQRYGHWNWRQLPKFAGLSRCGKSCRLRWINYLRPDVKRGNFSEEEDNLIIQMHKEFGNKWAVMASKLPGRTDNEIKNHWHTNLSKKVVKQRQSEESESLMEAQSVETSQSEVSRRNEKPEETESSSVNTPSESDDQPKTLENFTSSQELSCSEFSSSSTTNDSAGSGAINSINSIAEDSFSSMALFQDSDSDFWNLPFVSENNYNQDGYSSFFLADGEYMSLYGSNYDDGLEWIQQVMRELEDI